MKCYLQPQSENSLDCHLMANLETEAEKLRHALKQMCFILFLAERELAEQFWEQSQIGNIHNRNFLGIVVG